jgi:RNA ligase
VIYKNVPTLEEFMKAHEQGRVSMSEHGDYVLFKYKAETQYSRDWDEVTLHARGIVFDKTDGSCVVYPFKKFFNLGETGCELSEMPDDGEYELLEKMDGSMGCIFLNKDLELQVFTPGAFESDQAVWATNWLRNYRDYERVRNLFLNGEVEALITEIVCQISKVVVLYDFEGLVLIGGQASCSIASGVRYMTHDELLDVGYDTGLPVCKKFDFKSIDEVKKHLEEVSNFEGFVLHWPWTGFRLKMKADEYVRNHRILSSVHPNRIDEAIDVSEPNTWHDVATVMKEVIQEFPEEHSAIYEEAHELFTCKMVHADSVISQIVRPYMLREDAKELAMDLQSDKHGEDGKKYFSFIMACFRNKPFVKKLCQSVWQEVREELFSE